MRMQWIVVAASLALSGSALAEDAPADIWKAKCKGCHGEDGAAKTRAGQKENIADFTSAEWQKGHSDEKIRVAIAEGSKTNSKMKAFKDRLTPAEIDSLVKYIRGFGKK
jgi:mono/diheme cytochrome c family protein